MGRIDKELRAIERALRELRRVDWRVDDLGARHRNYRGYEVAAVPSGSGWRWRVCTFTGSAAQPVFVHASDTARDLEVAQATAIRWVDEHPRRRGGKLRFDPSQLRKGIAEELEHAATIKKIQRNPKLPVKQAAELIAKDHLKKHPKQYDRLEAVEVPKRGKGLKAPRLKLLHHSGRLRVYLVDSHAVRKLYGDWTMGGHHRVYLDFIPPREVWIAEEVFDPERKLCTIHELAEYARMGGGMGYDEAHDLSTALEQKFRKGGMRGVDAALRHWLKVAAAS